MNRLILIAALLGATPALAVPTPVTVEPSANGKGVTVSSDDFAMDLDGLNANGKPMNLGPDGVLVLAQDGSVEYANAAAVVLLGADPAEVNGAELRRFSPDLAAALDLPLTVFITIKTNQHKIDFGN